MPINPRKSTALLIGVSEFPKDSKLPSLPEVEHNIEDLADLLRDESLVGFTDVRVLLNESTDVIGDSLPQAIEATEDTLFIYYAGHGVVSSGNFYLTGRNSTESSRSAE